MLAAQVLNPRDNGKENGNCHIGLHRVSGWDNGKENGNYNRMLGKYWENGEGNGNYYLEFRV